MSALDTLLKICENNYLMNANLKLCLIDSFKLPHKINGEMAKSNQIEDFVSIENLVCDDLDKYAGIGISIQASNICAIDIDHCFDVPFEIESLNSLTARDIIMKFCDWAYIEFSFSGTGIRILFKQNKTIDNYADEFYIKNSKIGVEFYQPGNSNRYVTLTGMTIYNNPIDEDHYREDALYTFLSDYMMRPKQNIKVNSKLRNTSVDLVKSMNLVKKLYLTDSQFQELWFSQAPGSGHDESERDYRIICYLYENISQNREVIRQTFESSPYYKSKDWKHLEKWKKNNYNYFNYVYDKIGGENE